jgi:hypothetical protein
MKEDMHGGWMYLLYIQVRSTSRYIQVLRTYSVNPTGNSVKVEDIPSHMLCEPLSVLVWNTNTIPIHYGVPSYLLVRLA